MGTSSLENDATVGSSIARERGRHIEASVLQSLRLASYSALRRVHCEFHEGVVTLRGWLPSYYLKQLAQTLATKVAGVEQIVNRIAVDRHPANDNSRERPQSPTAEPIAAA